MVRLAVADEDAAVPPSVAVTDETVPTKPRTVRVTTVPTGMFAAVMVTGTGFVVPAGSVMSGVTKEPWATPGVATPAIELMRSVGAFARTAGLGSEDEIVVGGTATKFNTAVFVNDSRRKRPALPAPLKKKPPEPPKNPPMRSPPFTSIVPFPPTVLATSLTAPPLPLPPNPADGLGPAAPLPPRARIVPDNVMVVDDARAASAAVGAEQRAGEAAGAARRAADVHRAGDDDVALSEDGHRRVRGVAREAEDHAAGDVHRREIEDTAGRKRQREVRRRIQRAVGAGAAAVELGVRRVRRQHDTRDDERGRGPHHSVLLTGS